MILYLASSRTIFLFNDFILVLIGDLLQLFHRNFCIFDNIISGYSHSISAITNIASFFLLPINLFQILNRSFGSKGMKDHKITFHSLGRSLLVNFLAALAGEEMPEAI